MNSSYNDIQQIIVFRLSRLKPEAPIHTGAIVHCDYCNAQCWLTPNCISLYEKLDGKVVEMICLNCLNENIKKYNDVDLIDICKPGFKVPE